MVYVRRNFVHFISFAVLSEPEQWIDRYGQWIPAKGKGNPEKRLEQKSFLDMISVCLSELPDRPATALKLKTIERESFNLFT